MSGRRFLRTALVAGLVLVTAFAVGCSNDGPTGVVGFDVAGEWIEISTVISDECELGLDPTSTAPLTILVSGTQILFVYHLEGVDAVLSGTFDPQSGEFTLLYDAQGQGLTISGQQAGSFDSDSSYTSVSEVVVMEDETGTTCTLRTSEVGQRA